MTGEAEARPTPALCYRKITARNIVCPAQAVLYFDFHMSRREGAGERRTRELKALAAKGIVVCFESPWKARVGALHIWPYSGRWLDERTGRAGRINRTTVRELIERL